jgi:hypothetical protein
MIHLPLIIAACNSPLLIARRTVRCSQRICSATSRIVRYAITGISLLRPRPLSIKAANARLREEIVMDGGAQIRKDVTCQ